MSMESYLSPAGVIFLNGTTREEVLEELVVAACSANSMLNADTLRDALREREKTSTTQLGLDLAFPHARIPGLHDVVVTIGRRLEGVPWDPSTDRYVYLVILIISDQNRGDAYVRVLAELARMLRDGALHQKIKSAKSPREVYEVLIHAGSEQAGT